MNSFAIRFMRKLLLVVCLLSGSQVFSACPAHAESSRTVTLSGVADAALDVDSLWEGQSQGWRDIDSPALFSARIPTIGSVVLQLRRAQFPGWARFIGEEIDTSQFLLLQGEALVPGRAYRDRRRRVEKFAALLERKEGRDELRITMEVKPIRRSSPRRIVQVTARMSRQRVASGRVERAPIAGLRGKACAAHLAGEHGAEPAYFRPGNSGFNGRSESSSMGSPSINAESLPDGRSVAAAASYRQIQLSTEADYEYFRSLGGNTNSRIAAVVNAVDAIYGEQLQMTMTIVGQHVFQSSKQPITSSAPETLLKQFRDYTRANGQLPASDLYHLFSGKDFNDTVIGIAYLSGTCGDLAYGASQLLNSTLSPIVLAHEVGHNLSATHDDATQPPTIMSTSLNGNSPPTEFSAFSKSEIRSFLNSSAASCLTSVDGTDPPPTKTPTPRPTATRTPAPGETIAPAPSPTPTVSGGGGGGVGGGVPTPLPEVFVTAALNAAGNFSATVRSSTPIGGCNVYLRADENRAKSARVSTPYFYSVIAAEDILLVQTTLAKRVQSKLRKKPLAYLTAELECAAFKGQSSISKPVKIAFGRLASRGKGFTVKRYFQKLGEVLEVVIPAR